MSGETCGCLVQCRWRCRFGFEPNLNPGGRVERRLLKIVNEAGSVSRQIDDLVQDLVLRPELVLDDERVLPDGDALDWLITIRAGFPVAQDRVRTRLLCPYRSPESRRVASIRPDVGDRRDLGFLRIRCRPVLLFVDNVDFHDLDRPCAVAAEVSHVGFEAAIAARGSSRCSGA